MEKRKINYTGFLVSDIRNIKKKYKDKNDTVDNLAVIGLTIYSLVCLFIALGIAFSGNILLGLAFGLVNELGVLSMGHYLEKIKNDSNDKLGLKKYVANERLDILSDALKNNNIDLSKDKIVDSTIFEGLSKECNGIKQCQDIVIPNSKEAKYLEQTFYSIDDKYYVDPVSYNDHTDVNKKLKLKL